MNTPFILAAVGAFLLASCASPLERRIEKNPKIYAALSEKHKEMVQRGQVEEGMTKEAVFMSWGKPDRIKSGSKQGKATERWSYTGYEAVQSTSIGIGLGFGYGYGRGRYGHHGRGYYEYDPLIYPQTSVDYIPYEAAHVEFTGDRVTAWSVAH